MSRFILVAKSKHPLICRYLHEACSPSLVHKNIKSENILLDADLNPHLSDSGLANLMADVDQVNTINLCLALLYSTIS